MISLRKFFSFTRRNSTPLPEGKEGVDSGGESVREGATSDPLTLAVNRAFNTGEVVSWTRGEPLPDPDGPILPMESVQCEKCGRGKEACQYCFDGSDADWFTICDCGLWDFGLHLSDCLARQRYKFVIVDDHEAAGELR